jgi:hypothetical protein
MTREAQMTINDAKQMTTNDGRRPNDARSANDHK